MNQRRSGEGYPQSSFGIEKYKELLENYGYDDDRLRENRWEEVGFRVGIAHGDVEIEKVSEVGLRDRPVGLVKMCANLHSPRTKAVDNPYCDFLHTDSPFLTFLAIILV